MTYAEWSQAVREKLLALQMSQYALAKKTGCSEPTIKRLLVGRLPVRDRTIREVSQALGMELTAINTMIDDMRKSKTRVADAVTAHFARHANCAECEGTGEVPDLSDNLGGHRLCSAEPWKSKTEHEK